jgi:hypothetical protein
LEIVEVCKVLEVVVREVLFDRMRMYKAVKKLHDIGEEFYGLNVHIC